MDFQPRVHERERKKNAKDSYFGLETRYRKILAKLLRVSSEKQRKQAKGKKYDQKRNCAEKRKHPRRDSNTSCARSQLPEVTLLRNGWLGKIVNFKAVFFAIRTV